MARVGGRGALRLLRPHPRWLLVLVLALLVPVVDGSAPAQAAGLTAPVARVVAGNSTLTVAWPAVAGARKYEVQYSASKKFTAAKTVSAGTRTTLAVRKLTNSKRYYVRVVAIKGSRTAVGRTVGATPVAGYPGELTVTVVPAGKNKILVSWTGQTRATQVAVIAGANGTVTDQSFHSQWHAATTNSIRLTVPVKYRAVLGTGSGNPVFVRVATWNSATERTSLRTSGTWPSGYRLSAVGAHSLVGSTEAGGAKIRVATYNVKSSSASATLAGYTWQDRRLAVAASIERSSAAVVAVQEADRAAADPAVPAVKQWQDLRDLLAEPEYGGYAMADTVTPASSLGQSPVSIGAHLFYRPDVLKKLDDGIVSPKLQLHVGWPSDKGDRMFSWAEFRVRSTGEVFYAVSVHLPVDGATVSYEALREREIAGIATYLAAEAGSAPVVVMGDFNSYLGEDGTDPATVLRGKGYYDAAATAVRRGSSFNTVNTAHQVDNVAVHGFPFTPHRYLYSAPRLDHIMVKNSPGAYRYVNQVVLTSSGTFDRAFQGSDHNLQYADLGIR